MDTTARRLFTPEPHGQSPTEPTADHRAAVPVASGAWVEEFVFRFLLVFFVFLLPRRFARKTNAGTQRNRLCKLFLITENEDCERFLHQWVARERGSATNIQLFWTICGAF